MSTRTVAAGLLGAAALGAALAPDRSSPVGHWRSTAGRAAYFAAYDATFADLPRPAATLDVRTDYGVVRVYRFAGRGTARSPLLLLPGTTSGTPMWADNLPSLLELADVYALDLLGEPGHSIQDRPITDDADKASWLAQVLADLPEERLHLLGHSLGGWTALNLALHHREDVASVSVLDPVVSFGDLPWGTIVRSPAAVLPWLPRSWRDAFTSYVSGGAEVEDLPVARMIEAGMGQYRMTAPPPTRISPQRLGELEVPVLAIIAGKSVMHDPAQAARTARAALSDGRVEVLAEASHALNGEYPEEIASLVGDFVTEVEARRPAGQA
ncbi:alpha/beta fold hydrolase [Brachybacterium sacelli]|uniref:Pimeloyl-ACP methyl ester carboxylesterase n=1 Tax=Brachybacterium sacelli TaxID=173364 RepID=A0ABS4X6I5_9MICO|nr:alpha/beta hydrolase [Brachybacterium sacelli]MBP2384065.1 pimeloyl-ACP methyl ester carboxylesterase [Brachybacterium sacelli]